MAVVAKSNFKAIVERRGLSLRRVADDIGYRFESVRKLAIDDFRDFPRELLGRLCVYLGVPISELIIMVDEETGQRVFMSEAERQISELIAEQDARMVTESDRSNLVKKA